MGNNCSACRWNGFCAHQHYQGNPGCDCAMFQSHDEHISILSSGHEPTPEERKAWQDSFVVDKVEEIKKMNEELLNQWKKALKELEKYKKQLQEVQNEAAFNAACADETSDDCDAALIMKDAEIDELKKEVKRLRKELNLSEKFKEKIECLRGALGYIRDHIRDPHLIQIASDAMRLNQVDI